MAEANETVPIRSGDIVFLRSGSPKLTVLDVGRDTGQVWCRWMSEGGVTAEGTFPAQALKRPGQP
jgi:uncharacterized protein YodC (DUF2158 family)